MKTEIINYLEGKIAEKRQALKDVDFEIEAKVEAYRAELKQTLKPELEASLEAFEITLAEVQADNIPEPVVETVATEENEIVELVASEVPEVVEAVTE